MEGNEDNSDHEIFIELLIEPTVVVNTDKLNQAPPTLAQRFSGIFYALASAFLFTSSVFITKTIRGGFTRCLTSSFCCSNILIFHLYEIDQTLFILFSKNKK